MSQESDQEMIKFKALFIGPASVGKSLIKTIYINKFENFEYDLMEYSLLDEEEDLDFLSNLITQTEKIIYISSITIAIEQTIRQIKMIHSINYDNIPFYSIFNKIDLEDEEALDLYQQKITLETATLPISIIYTSFKGDALKQTIQAILNIVDPELRYENGLYELILLERTYGLINKCMNNNGLLLSAFKGEMEHKSISLDYILDTYKKMKLINLINDPEGTYIFPTVKGRKFYISRMRPFINQVLQIEETNRHENLEREWFKHPIHGLLFTDDSGRRFFVYEYSPNELSIVLNSNQNENFDLDLVAMFLNALQKFGHEINFTEILHFEIVSENIRLLSLKKGHIVMSVFFPSQSPYIQHKEYFENLLNQFLDRNEEQIKILFSTGCTHQFDPSKLFFDEYILKIEQHIK